MDDLASQAEVASSRGEQGKVYKITKVVFGKFCGLTDALVGDKEGGLPISEEIDDHWAEHLVKSWTGCCQQHKLTTRKQGMILTSTLHHQRKKRSSRPSSPLKTEMLPGQDNLNAELFKAALGFAAEINSSTLYNHMGKKKRNE